MVLQRILHGECLDELLRADKTQSVLKVENRMKKTLKTTITVICKRKMMTKKIKEKKRKMM